MMSAGGQIPIRRYSASVGEASSEIAYPDAKHQHIKDHCLAFRQRGWANVAEQYLWPEGEEADQSRNSWQGQF